MRRTIGTSVAMLSLVAAAGCGDDDAAGVLPDPVAPTSAETASVTALPSPLPGTATATVVSNPPETTAPATSGDTPHTASIPAPSETLIGSCLERLDRAEQIDASMQTEREALDACNTALVAWGRARLDLTATMRALEPDAPGPVQEAFGSNLDEFREGWNEIASPAAAPTPGTMASCIAALSVFEDASDPSAAGVADAIESCAAALANADAAAQSLAVVCEALALGPDRREADRLTGDIEAFTASWSLVAG